MRTALSIAGTDPTGGAGIQADLKTFAAHRVYGMAAITSVIAQNTMGVRLSEPVGPRLLRAQLDAVFTDIPPDAVKIGLMVNAEAIEATAGALTDYGAMHIVIDTVMVSSSGFRFLDRRATRALTETLFPLAQIITPNIPEAEELCGFPVADKEGMILAAKRLIELGPKAVLVKGGHLDDGQGGQCDDLFLDEGGYEWLSSPRVKTKDTHGTGCALSSAIAANLALGKTPREAARLAKGYLHGAIAAGLRLGKGKGPFDHGWQIPRPD